MAVPTTVVYKLTFGLTTGQPPFTAADAEALEQQYANGNFPWPVEGGGSAGVSAVGTSLGSFPFPGAGILMILNGTTYGIIDVLNDLYSYTANKRKLTEPKYVDPMATFFSWASIVTTIVGQWATAPYDIFPSHSTKAEKLTLAVWGLNFAPVVYGTIFTVISPTHALSVFNHPYFNTACGLAFLGLGIAATVEQIEDSTNKYGPCYWVQNILAPLPTIFKPLTTIMGQPEGGIAIGCLMLCDGVMDVANFSLAFVEDCL
jgi:hypothetical protein